MNGLRKTATDVESLDFARGLVTFLRIRMSRTVAIAVATVVAIGAAGAGYWVGTRQSPPAAAPAAAAKGGGQQAAGPGTTVEATKVVTAPMPQTITAVGSLRSDESVTLRPETAGRISAITFQEGQRVARGTPLVKLDPAIPEAEYAQAKANLTLAKAKFDRAVDLANRNYISGQAKDEAENSYRVAEATLQLAQAKLAKTEIRAPFAGIIGLRSVSMGDYVKEGADLVNLESIDPLKVDFRVPETYLRQVQPGQSLTITLDAMPGSTFDGKVVALNPLVDAAGRSIVIRAQVRNQDTVLRPGMFARVRLITKDQADAMIVPEQALVPQGSEQYVFKIIDNKAARVKIETGQRRDGKVEVIAGLVPGDLIVTAGQLKIRDGSPVTVMGRQDDKAANAPASPRVSSAGPNDAGPSPIVPADASVKSTGMPARPPKS
jgi:membrane fusion protein (multidrug efflux system)